MVLDAAFSIATGSSSTSSSGRVKSLEQIERERREAWYADYQDVAITPSSHSSSTTDEAYAPGDYAQQPAYIDPKLDAIEQGY